MHNKNTEVINIAVLMTSFASGAMLTAGSDYGDTGTSGLNEITNRINVESGILGTVSGAGVAVSGAVVVVSGATVTTNGTLTFGLYDIPQNQDMTYTTNTAGNITAATISGPTHNYTVVGSYNGEENPIEIIFSGTSIGSTIKQVFWYQTNGSLATSTGSIISGTMAVF